MTHRADPLTPWAPEPLIRPWYAAAGEAAPTVVIITDARGREVAWPDLARTVCEQSLQHWRWIIVGAADIPEPLAGDGRVALADAAPSDAGLPAACAYVCLLDAAVSIAPTFMEKCVWLLAGNPAAAFCNARATDGRVWEYGFEQGPKFLEENFAGRTCVLRRSAYREIAQIADGPLAVWEGWLRLAAAGMWGQTIPEALIRYRAIDRDAPFRPADAELLQQFRASADLRYTHLRGSFPTAQRPHPQPYAALPEDCPLENELAPAAGTRRMLILMPWLIVGGAERVNLDLISHLVAHGRWQISIATTIHAAHGWAAEFARYTPDIFLLNQLVAPLDYARCIAALIESRTIDVVLISNCYDAYLLLPYLRARFPGVAFVDLLHSQQESWKNGGYPRCGVAYQEMLDLNIAASGYVKRWMVGRGADAGRIEISYTNIDTEKWRPDTAARARQRAALQLTEDQTLIVFHGRLSAEKRPELLMRIMARLQHEAGDRFRCAVIGDGPERATVERLLRELQLDPHVMLLGRLGDADLHSYLAAADILVLPSQVEGISVSTFESMAMGIVPVSADVGGQAELIASECGFLVPHGPHELEEYVAILRRLVLDRDLCRAMGARARERVEQHFPLSAFGPRMETLLEEALRRHREEPRPPVGLGLAREHAVQALEGLRLERAVDELWAERERLRSQGAPAPVYVPARSRMVNAAWARLTPLYRWSQENGMSWLRPLKARALAWIQRRGV